MSLADVRAGLELARARRRMDAASAALGRVGAEMKAKLKKMNAAKDQVEAVFPRHKEARERLQREMQAFQELVAGGKPAV